MSRTFYETVVFPYPKGKVKLELHERKRDGNFVLQYEQVIDPVGAQCVRQPEHPRLQEFAFTGTRGASHQGVGPVAAQVDRLEREYKAARAALNGPDQSRAARS